MYGENKTWVISCNISHSNFLMANMEFMCLMGWRFLSLKLCSRICFVETNVEKCLSEVILNLFGLLCPPESSLLCLSLNLHVFILYRTGWVFYISLWLQSAFVLHLWDKNPFQLASYAVHSTETVLLWLLNDILPSLDVHKLLIFSFFGQLHSKSCCHDFSPWDCIWYLFHSTSVVAVLFAEMFSACVSLVRSIFTFKRGSPKLFAACPLSPFADDLQL